MQILRDQPATLQVRVYDEAGDLTNLDAPAVLAVTDANGDAVSSGDVSSPSTGIYESVLPSQDPLAELEAVWSGDLSTVPIEITQHYAVVGNLLFTEAEARTAKTSGGQTPLSDDTAYPDETIAAMRELITDQFELRTGRSWIGRYARVELHGNGQQVISLSRGIPRAVDGTRSGGPGWFRDVSRILSCTVSGSTVDVADLVLDRHQIFHTTGTFTQATTTNPLNVVFEIEYGDDWVSSEAKEHGIRTALATLVKSDLSSWAETVNTLEGTERFPGGGLVFPPATREWFAQNQPTLSGTGRWGIA